MSKQRDLFHFVTRFWDRVERGAADACWPWTASRKRRGYGHVGWINPETGQKQMMVAHRVAYHLTHGAPPLGHVVMHTCDNPPCCNPAHLITGTVAENNADRSQKGRTARPGVGNWRARSLANQARGSQHTSAKLTEHQVREIRALCEARRLTQRQIGVLYGVSQSAVMQIHARRNWGHLP
jgi:hypothetical protein